MRIGIVADDAATADTLRRVILSADCAATAWTAASGSQTLAMCLGDPVDLVLLHMDLREHVPALVERLRRETGCTILLTAEADQGYAPEVFEAIRLGAVDVVVEPVAAGGEGSAGARELIEKLSRVQRLMEGPQRTGRRASRLALAQPLVILGASTGGPQALATVLAGLPADLPAPVVIIQHLDPEFTDGMIEWLDSTTSLAVVPVVSGACPEVGRVWVATGSRHVTLDQDGSFRTSREPQDLPYRPSVDVFCRSAAQHWRGKGAAVLLTGLGRDGGAGLLALRRVGWHTIAQDRSTSAVFGMPREAERVGAAVEVLALTEIAPALVRGLAATRGVWP